MVKPIEVTPSIMELRMLFHIMTRKILTCPRRATWGISESKEVFLMEPHRIGLPTSEGSGHQISWLQNGMHAGLCFISLFLTTFTGSHIHVFMCLCGGQKSWFSPPPWCSKD